MRIIVRSEEARFRIPIPSWLVFSDLSALFLPKILSQNGTEITRKQAVKLCRAFRKCIRHHKGLTLVEASTSTGQYVEIRL